MKRTPIEGHGEILGADCGFCHEYIYGKVWAVKTLEEVIGKERKSEAPANLGPLLACMCGNCGFTYCSNKHKKELRQYGVKLFKIGNCPNCGHLLDLANLRRLHQLKEEDLFREGCMFCGANETLEKMEIWSGEMVAGQNITPDITWAGLVVLIPGEKAGKVIDVQSCKYLVCEKCSSKKVPESFTEFVRKKHAELSFHERHFVAQREPFSEAYKLGLYVDE